MRFSFPSPENVGVSNFFACFFGMSPVHNRRGVRSMISDQIRLPVIPFHLQNIS
jgi:hypothetical protein